MAKGTEASTRHSLEGWGCLPRRELHRLRARRPAQEGVGMGLLGTSGKPEAGNREGQQERSQVCAQVADAEAQAEAGAYEGQAAACTPSRRLLLTSSI